MFYFVKTPGWLKKIYYGCTWQMNTAEKKIYLSFDDGPHPVATKFVLETLNKYNARATFFCIGKNVAAHPDMYQQILAGGHAVGNHTFHHLNGWKTPSGLYIENIERAQQLIKASIFRPPYGKISFRQLKTLSVKQPSLKVIMWTVLSADFDRKIAPEKCLQNVLENTGNGSIIVFHDSEKAFENLRFALPKMMDHFANLGYSFERING
jgi:peptidoglycan/xylan/chitin deacetylase (PgdA/CDA1 family)